MPSSGGLGKDGRARVVIPLYAPRPAANFTALATPLPENVHLLTVHSWGPGQLLLRLSHSFEVGEDALLSANATVAVSPCSPCF